jgi:hypothetical protein
MIDIARVLDHLGIEGWEVVERDGSQEITKFPKGVKRPTQKQLADAWAEVQAIDTHGEIEQARKARYEQETDNLLYDALAKLDLPELKGWKDAREKVKEELSYEE